MSSTNGRNHEGRRRSRLNLPVIVRAGQTSAAASDADNFSATQSFESPMTVVNQEDQTQSPPIQNAVPVLGPPGSLDRKNPPEVDNLELEMSRFEADRERRDAETERVRLLVARDKAVAEAESAKRELNRLRQEREVEAKRKSDLLKWERTAEQAAAEAEVAKQRANKARAVAAAQIAAEAARREAEVAEQEYHQASMDQDYRLTQPARRILDATSHDDVSVSADAPPSSPPPMATGQDAVLQVPTQQWKPPFEVESATRVPADERVARFRQDQEDFIHPSVIGDEADGTLSDRRNNESRGGASAPSPEPSHRESVINRAAVRQAGLDVDSGELPVRIPITVGRERLDRGGNEKIAGHNQDLGGIDEADDIPEATRSEPNRSFVKDVGEGLSGIMVGVGSKILLLLKQHSVSLKKGLTNVLLPALVILLIVVAVTGSSSSASQERCEAPSWAPHTILWLEDCASATTDKRTVATVSGKEYNLMAERPQGFKPQSILYTWMLVGTGGNDAYTNAPQQLSGLIPQTREKLTEAAKGLGLPESSLTEVNNSKTKFGAPSHTSSWWMAVWSLNKAWGTIANNPLLRTQYDARCAAMNVKEVQVGHQVSLCAILMHVLPPKWTEKQPGNDKSVVRLLVNLVTQWGSGESQAYEDIKPSLEKKQIKIANERACGKHSPGVIKGVNCP